MRDNQRKVFILKVFSEDECKYVIYELKSFDENQYGRIQKIICFSWRDGSSSLNIILTIIEEKIE